MTRVDFLEQLTRDPGFRWQRVTVDGATVVGSRQWRTAVKQWPLYRLRKLAILYEKGRQQPRQVDLNQCAIIRTDTPPAAIWQSHEPATPAAPSAAHERELHRALERVAELGMILPSFSTTWDSPDIFWRWNAAVKVYGDDGRVELQLRTRQPIEEFRRTVMHELWHLHDIATGAWDRLHIDDIEQRARDFAESMCP
jgi:hypothetical protein